jgi:outer membrane cobalamin receptor
LLLAVLGCSQRSRTANTLAAPGTFLITAEEIEKSGARAAWQVLKQRAPMLSMQEDRNGRLQSTGRRGRSSFVLDGVRVADFDALDTIEAQSISTILIYDGVEGTTYYGTDAVSGLIQTKEGRES